MPCVERAGPAGCNSSSGDVVARAMRLVDLCPYGVYPPRSGGHRLVHHTSYSLGARHDILVFAMGLRRFEGLRVRSFVQRPGNRYVEYRHITPLTYLSYLRRRRTGLPPLRASSELRLTAPRRLRSAIASADIVQVQQPWQFAFARRTASCPVVLVVQNAEVQLLESRGLPRRLVRLAAELERRALAQADAVIFVSSEDRATLADTYGLAPARWHTCGVGVDTDAFRPATAAERQAAQSALGLAGPVAVFAGSWHLPNRSAVDSIQTLAARSPDWTFLVVGSVGSASESQGRFRVTGPVDDPLPFLRAADVALNPMTEGSGVNLKVLEYLASGLPTVTTSFGLRGFDLGTVVTVSDLADFPSALAALREPDRRERLGRAGRAAVERHHSWEAVARAREDIYAQLTAGPPHA
jgi:glycosyltransferase involved in cell wall biosynthesis